jgi:sigma-B regulation protein RsbU (phosphoserine phosphatase)
VPIIYQNRTSGVLNVADKRSGQHFTWFDLRILSTIAGQIVEAYRNIDLEKEQFDNRDLRKELDIAASIQRRLLPVCSIEKPGFSGYARIRMAQAVGGDFYAFFEMGSGRFGVAIADVSGKSIPAAIFGTMLRNGFLKISRETPLPGEVLYRLNQTLHPDSEAGMFATMAYLVCDINNHLLITASAGHLPVYLLRVGEGRIEELNPRGIPLAIQENSLYKEKAVLYTPGDLLFFHTDGITEERFRDGSEFGEERLKAFLLGHSDCQPERLTELLMDTLEEGSGHRPEEDDYTCIAIRL